MGIALSMSRGIFSKIDPMIAVLLCATFLAVVLPSVGEAREIAGNIANVAIFLLFLANGMRIARREILRGFANWRFFLPLAIFVFGVMALIGVGMSQLAESLLDPKVALGFLFLGCLPSTIQSATSYTTLADGNVALSIVGAALINILGVFVTAPLFAAIAGSEAVQIGNEVIIRIGLILILPFVIGQIVQGWTIEWMTERKSQLAWLDRIVIGILVYTAFSGAIEQGIGTMLSAAGWGIFAALTCLFLLLANGGAWLASGLLGYPRADRIAFLFAAAQKSVAIGAPLAAIMFTPAVAGFVIAPLLLYHLLQLMMAAPLAGRFAKGA